MIGLDTNVLVRYVAQDDPKQSPMANRLIESLTVDARGYVSVVSIVELVWVLTDCYALTKAELCDVLGALLRTKEIVVAHAGTVWQALRLFKDGKADFADCLIERFANEAGCDYTGTFDRDAAKHCGMRLVG
ncbi:MAG: type II toxin-antitoxin system VapC family toxin [Sulfuritalea sp.]|nr:type II toxin-antitoxin system VapC family toxin [Sulfuritalea sp.]MDP1985453.1 type II toxin-antitoxin system VapC family toxin [Sulfuritalea sp.]